MNWSTREHGSKQEGWSPTLPLSPLAVNPVRARHSLRFGAACRAPKTVPRKVHPRNLSGSLSKGHLVRVAKNTTSRSFRSGSSRLFEGWPTMNIPGFTLQHARTVASCVSSSVKSHVSSNKAIPRKSRVVPTLLTSRFSCCILNWGFRFGHIASRWPDAPGEKPTSVGWESSTMQLKNPSGMSNDSVTCSPDSTFCLDTSPTAVTWFSGRCPNSQNNWRYTSWSMPFSCPCTFRGTLSRRLNGNHVRVGTLEAPPVYKSNIAPVQAES